MCQGQLGSHPYQPKEQREVFMQWNEKDKMIIFVLSQNISNSMICHIQQLETSEEV